MGRGRNGAQAAFGFGGGSRSTSRRGAADRLVDGERDLDYRSSGRTVAEDRRRWRRAKEYLPIAGLLAVGAMSIAGVKATDAASDAHTHRASTSDAVAVERVMEHGGRITWAGAELNGKPGVVERSDADLSGNPLLRALHPEPAMEDVTVVYENAGPDADVRIVTVQDGYDHDKPGGTEATMSTPLGTGYLTYGKFPIANQGKWDYELVIPQDDGSTVYVGLQRDGAERVEDPAAYETVAQHLADGPTPSN